MVESQTRGGSLPGLLRMFMAVSVVFTVLSWIVAVESWRLGHDERGGMWARFDDRFTDLTHYDGVFPLLHTRAFFTGGERFAYPAPSAVAYDVLLHLGPHRLMLYLLFTVLVAVVPAVWFGRRLVLEGVGLGAATGFVVVLVVTSWPLLFLLERANLETVLIVLTFAGAAAFWTGRMSWAALFWGLAAAMKIYPALLLVLFAYRGRLRAFWVGVATMVGTLVASFRFVGPTMGIAARGTMEGIGGFVGTYANHSREWELRHDHSYLAFLKQPLAIHRLHLSTDVSSLSHGYFAVVAVAVPILYFVWFRRLPQTNQYLVAMVAIVTLPPVSYDYTLMHLYPGFVLLTLLLLGVRREGVEMPALRPLFWCFTLVFASENFAFYIAFHLNGMIKAAALFWACVVLFRTPLPMPVSGLGGVGRAERTPRKMEAAVE